MHSVDRDSFHKVQHSARDSFHNVSLVCDSFHNLPVAASPVAASLRQRRRGGGGGVVRGVCGVWRGVWCWSWVCLEERYPLDGLKPKKCLPLFMRIAMVESRTCIFFWCYVGVTP